MTDPKLLTILNIEKTVNEAPNIKTFYFNHRLHSQPGQFVMIWIPHVGEKPMSIAQDTGKTFSLTVCAVGAFSKALYRLKPGQPIGIRGPLGTHFNLQGTNIAVIGGGYGAGPMASIAELAKKQGYKKKNIHYMVGAKNKELLLFEKRMQNTATIHISTDDGSKGTKGFVTDVLINLIKEGRQAIDMIYCCGPEMMEKAIFDIAVKENIDCEISIERYMKCGIGICGSCNVDPLGIRMCVEGPVVNKTLASKISEFGVYHRDATGKKINF